LAISSLRGKKGCEREFTKKSPIMPRAATGRNHSPKTRHRLRLGRGPFRAFAHIKPKTTQGGKVTREVLEKRQGGEKGVKPPRVDPGGGDYELITKKGARWLTNDRSHELVWGQRGWITVFYLLGRAQK